MALPRLSGPLFSMSKTVPFPARMDCKLNYCLVNNIVAGNGTQYLLGTPFSMALNDLTTTNGHQPYGYDTLASVYSNFRVTHVDVEVQLMADLTGTSDMVGALVAVLPNGATYPASGDALDRWAEVPGVWTKVLGVAGAASTVTLRQRIPIAAIEGLNPAQLEASPNYASFSGAAVPYSPEIIIAGSNEKSTSMRGLTMKISCVFTCTFWQRKQLPQS